MESDPTAMLRAWLGEWEKLASSVSGDALKSDEFARSLHGAGAATMGMQATLNQAIDRALASTNLPSRADLVDLSARVGRMEASLSRIETLLAGTRPAPPASPRRTRKPPAN